MIQSSKFKIALILHSSSRDPEDWFDLGWKEWETRKRKDSGCPLWLISVLSTLIFLSVLLFISLQAETPGPILASSYCSFKKMDYAFERDERWGRARRKRELCFWRVKLSLLVDCSDDIPGESTVVHFSPSSFDVGGKTDWKRSWSSKDCSQLRTAKRTAGRQAMFVLHCPARRSVSLTIIEIRPSFSSLKCWEEKMRNIRWTTSLRSKRDLISPSFFLSFFLSLQRERIRANSCDIWSFVSVLFSAGLSSLRSPARWPDLLAREGFVPSFILLHRLVEIWSRVASSSVKRGRCVHNV